VAAFLVGLQWPNDHDGAVLLACLGGGRRREKFGGKRVVSKG